MTPCPSSPGFHGIVYAVTATFFFRHVFHAEAPKWLLYGVHHSNWRELLEWGTLQSSLIQTFPPLCSPKENLRTIPLSLIYGVRHSTSAGKVRGESPPVPAPSPPAPAPSPPPPMSRLSLSNTFLTRGSVSPRPISEAIAASMARSITRRIVSARPTKMSTDNRVGVGVGVGVKVGRWGWR